MIVVCGCGPKTELKNHTEITRVFRQKWQILANIETLKTVRKTRNLLN